MDLAAISLVLFSLLIGHPDADSAHEVRETTSFERCPTWFHQASQLGLGRPDAVVVGGIRAVTVCRFYENPNMADRPGLPPNNKLASERIIDRRHTARSLARAFDRLRPYPPQPHGSYPPQQKEMHLCSSEFGGGFYLRFLYVNGRQSSVVVVPSGCPRAVVGRHGGWLLLSGDLRQRLIKIAPLPQELADGEIAPPRNVLSCCGSPEAD